MNAGPLPMSNGITRLQTRFLGDRIAVDEVLAQRRTDRTPPKPTRRAWSPSAPDEIDWDDEVRLAVEARAAFSPDAMTGLEANLRFAGPETMETKIFGRLTAWQNWIFQRPNAVGEKGALTVVRRTGTSGIRLETTIMISAEKIPNNVNLSGNKRLQRALEHWQPKYIQWWRDMGPQGFQDYHQVYVRTAISVDPEGWAHFEYVKLPEYRWGIFLADPTHDRRIGFGDFFGQPVWQEVPGEFRNQLRRLIVTQGDTEPASVEQQRLLGHRCPSLYDLRNLFQVNVEEGRHLWAMVYLLHSYFGRDGRDEAEELLERQSGNRDKPRILDAFNEPIDNWLDFFMFTMFTDRDGKSQLMSLSESSLDPLSRTTRFMLTEEAHHMFVGETGIARILERTCQLMQRSGILRRRAQGRRDRHPDDSEVSQPVVQPEPRPARRRSLEQRGVLLRERPQGPRQGRHLRRPRR